MNDLVSISLAIMGYMVYSSARHTRQLAMLMKQQTDRLIADGNARLERYMQTMGVTVGQIFELVRQAQTP